MMTESASCPNRLPQTIEYYDIYGNFVEPLLSWPTKAALDGSTNSRKHRSDPGTSLETCCGTEHRASSTRLPGLGCKRDSLIHSKCSRAGSADNDVSAAANQEAHVPSDSETQRCKEKIQQLKKRNR
jgi:hypothetical protein